MSGSIRVRRVGDGPLWSISSSYFSPALVEHAKAVPGMRYDNPTRGWQGYPDAVTAVVERLKVPSPKAPRGIHCEGTDDLPDPDSWRETRTPFLFSTTNLRDYQVEGVRFLLARAREGALLADGMRLGKAQPVDEPVLTPSGWRPIGSLKVGDEVIGSDGKATYVKGVFPQGRREVFKVTFTDGASTRCCAEHLWQVRTPKDKYAERPGQVLTLAEIVDRGLFQPGTTNRRWFVPICPAPSFRHTKLIVDPYLLGALLANGSLGRRITHSGGPDQWALIADVLPDTMQLKRATKDDVRLQPREPHGQNTLRDDLYELNLIGMYSERKYVPKEYLLASKDDRLALLQGLFDNDGTVSKDGLTVEYNTVSPQLSEDVLYLVRSLGGVAWVSTRIPTYTHKGERKKGQLDHRIRVSMPEGTIPFKLPRKVTRFRPRTKFPPAHAFDRVESVGVQRCVCISVAAANGLYITRDFIVTHNSCQATITARAFKQKTLIICPSHVVGVWGRPKDAPEGPGEIAKWWPDAWRGVDGTDKGVVRLETVKPFKFQEAIRLLGEKAKLTESEQKTLDEARAAIAGFALDIETAQVVIGHFDIVYAWVAVLLAWGLSTLIIDEVHICAGWQSRRSDALKELSRFATRRIGISGTPVTNLPKNLHNVLEILAENRFGYFFTGKRPGCYSRLFCGSFQKIVGSGPTQKTVWDHSGRSNLDVPDGKYALTQAETLQARLKFLMLRRLKKDVDPQLPSKTRQVVDVSIPARNVIAITQPMLGKGGGELRRCLDLAADGKLKSVVSLVESHIAEDEKTLCFCYRRLFAEAVAAAVQTHAADNVLVVFVHGGLTQKERDKRIHKLRTHDGPGLLACTIDTTSTGIDLSFAAVAVVGELTWEPHELAQLEERLYRFGADSKALIQYVIARGTGDELILRGIINKLDTFERVIGATGDAMKEELTRKKEDGMKRLYAALAEMQREPVTKVRRGGKS